MKFLFVITSTPFSKDFNTVINLIENLRKRNHEVSIFLSGDGVYYLINPKAHILSELGVKVYFCSHSAHQRGIETPPKWAESSSTYNLSRMLGDFEKVIVFN